MQKPNITTRKEQRPWSLQLFVCKQEMQCNDRVSS
jgi:hypothetical protein